MAQNVVLQTKGKISLADMRNFVAACDEGGLPKDSEFPLTKSRGDDALRIVATLPANVRLVESRKVKIKRKTKKAQQVDEQIAEHKENKENGPVAYVPPVGRTTAPSQKKVKCPECNTKKPIVKVGRVNCIKPHITQGEPCNGSGIEVRKIPKEK